MRDQPLVDASVRAHLETCGTCRTKFPDLIERYQRFDRVFLDMWNQMVQCFEIVCKLEEPSLERFLSFRREDFLADGIDDESAEINFEERKESELGHITQIAYWRAVRLGAHIGAAMNKFASKFAGPSDIWLDWWRTVGTNGYSGFLHAAGPERFALALRARNLASLLPADSFCDQIFWLPADEDLESIPGVLWVEYSNDLDEWTEIQGTCPPGTKISTILNLSHKAALSEIGGLAGNYRTAEVSLLHQFSSDNTKARCSEELASTMPEVWLQLDAETREYLIAGVQISRTPFIDAPSLIVSAWAQAFECELRQKIIRPLCKELQKLGTACLYVPEQTSPVWKRDWSPTRYTLEQSVRLLNCVSSAQFSYFARAGFSKDLIIDAIKTVKEPRNKASHGSWIMDCEASRVKKQWLEFKGLRGGVFAVLCPR